MKNHEDVTERYKRFEAERRVHVEAMARQKDAQSQTRFVRHEVKNGLLAGIELCDSLRNAFDDMEKSATTANRNAQDGNTQTDTARRRIEELDVTLHEVLDTVLAEAMARDVIHEVYQPRLERLDVKGLLLSSGSMAGKAKRFSVELENDSLPFLLLDPQLLRYIHRNGKCCSSLPIMTTLSHGLKTLNVPLFCKAISNACKYGKAQGNVLTRLSFDASCNQFEMQVMNEPGVGHDMLLQIGDRASDSVFKQGESLHRDLDYTDKYISSGDGAW